MLERTPEGNASELTHWVLPPGAVNIDSVGNPMSSHAYENIGRDLGPSGQSQRNAPQIELTEHESPFRQHLENMRRTERIQQTSYDELTGNGSSENTQETTNNSSLAA